MLIDEIYRIEGNVLDLEERIENIGSIESEVYGLKEIIGERPYFLVAWFGRVKKHIGVFYSDQKVKGFISSCFLKSKRGVLKKRSPLFGCDSFGIERFYVPSNIPNEPEVNW